MFSEKDVLDAYFARRLNEDPNFDGDPEAVCRELVGDEENLDSVDRPGEWRRRYERGTAILEKARLVVSSSVNAGCPLPPDFPKHLDSPVVEVPAGYFATTSQIKHIALIAK